MADREFSSLAQRGREALESSRYEEAVEAFKGAIRLKPDNAWAHYNLGSAYCSLVRYDEAVMVFREAIRLKPGYYEAKSELRVAEYLLIQEKKHHKPPFWFNLLLYIIIALICLFIVTKIIASIK